MIRKPCVSGYFYPSGKAELISQIEESFLSPLGTKCLPNAAGKKSGKPILGVIVPHAGYAYSGASAAHSFKIIAESEYDIDFIIGFSHSGFGSCFSDEDWETPFGIVNTEEKLVGMLSKKTGIPINNRIHSREHSIEVQIPFIQYISAKNKSSSRVICLIVSDGTNMKKTAETISAVLNETGKRYCFLASSDFTHYGSNYGYLPFTKNPKENMHKLDSEAIKQIISLDGEGFLDYIRKTGATICGRNPICLMIELAKLHDSKPRLLAYYTSGDITGDYSSAVGYAAISFE